MNKQFYIAEVGSDGILYRSEGPFIENELNERINKLNAEYKKYIVFNSDSIQYPKTIFREDFKKAIELFVETPDYNNAREVFKLLRLTGNFLWGWGEDRREILRCAGINNECTSCSYTITTPTILSTLKVVIDQVGKNGSNVEWDSAWSEYEYETDGDAYRPPLRYCPIAVMARVATMINLTKISTDKLGVLIPTMLMLLPVLSDDPYTIKKVRNKRKVKKDVT